MNIKLLPSEVQVIFNWSNFPPKTLEIPITELSGHKSWLKAATDARKTLQDHKICCVFGQKSTGKTQMAAVIARTLMSTSAVTARYDFATQFLVEYEQRDRCFENLEDHFYAPHLIVIDEMHLFYTSPLNLSWLDGLVSKRINEGRQTLLIAEATPRTIRSFLPPGCAAKLDKAKGYIDCNWAPMT